MAELYFINEHTQKRYKVIEFNKDAGTVTLVGSHNKPFTEKFSKERFQAMGYALKQEQVSEGAQA